LKIRTACPDPGLALIASRVGALRRRWGVGLRDRYAVAEVGDRVGLVEHMTHLRPAVVFLDLSLPGLGGVEGVPAIQRLSPSSKIVVLDPAPDAHQAVFALLAGARGYCDRRIGPSLVLKAAEAVQRGEIWTGRSVVSHLLQRLTALAPGPARGAVSPPGSRTPFALLGPRERQIATLVGAGASNKEIARQLSISEATVKAHLTSVFRKLKVPDRLRLALSIMQGETAAAAPRRRPATHLPLRRPPARGVPTESPERVGRTSGKDPRPGRQRLES